MSQRQSRQLLWLTIAFAILLILIIIGANTGFEPFKAFYSVPAGDKVGHFLLIGTLSFLVNASLKARRVTMGPVQLLLGSLLVALVVTAEEFSQLFLVHRSFDLLDLAADYLGILLFGQLVRRFVAKRVA